MPRVHLESGHVWSIGQPWHHKRACTAEPNGPTMPFTCSSSPAFSLRSNLEQMRLTCSQAHGTHGGTSSTPSHSTPLPKRHAVTLARSLMPGTGIGKRVCVYEPRGHLPIATTEVGACAVERAQGAPVRAVGLLQPSTRRAFSGLNQRTQRIASCDRALLHCTACVHMRFRYMGNTHRGVRAHEATMDWANGRGS